MTAPLPVHIYLVLDRSGSMESIAGDVVGGFNQYLEEQQQQPGKCRFTFIQFDTQNPHEVLHDAKKIADIPKMTDMMFQPRGGTPLLDAEGMAIAAAEQRVLERAAAGKKEEAILFVTFTDGGENSSQDWTWEKLAEKKKACEDRGWAFSYLGVGLDAYAHGNQSMRIGTQAASTVHHDSTSAGVFGTYTDMSNATNNYRSAAAQGMSLSSTSLYDGTSTKTQAPPTKRPAKKRPATKRPATKRPSSKRP